MDAKEKGIMGALADPEVDFYTIPEFQRPFTWQDDQVEQLWDDLWENFTDSQLSSEAAEQSNGNGYFLGPLVFVRNKARKSFDIIDGQQRTTTLHILLWTIYHRLQEPEDRSRIESILLSFGRETKLRVSLNDASTLLAVRENVEDLTGDSNMVRCVSLLRKKVGGVSDAEVHSFWDYVRNSVLFVVIVADDYASAWQLFIGLNGKGEPLNPADLIKAHVCGNSEVGEDASNVWQTSILPLKSDATFCLLMITRYRLEKFVTENVLFKEFSRNFPSQIKTMDLASLSTVFAKSWLTPIDELAREFSFGTVSYRYLRMIRLLARRDHTPLLYKYAEAFGVKAIFEEAFLKPIAVFQLRMAVARKRSRERKIISWLKDKNLAEKDTAIAAITEFVKTEAPSDSDFEAFVAKLDYGATPSKAILLAHEEGERGNKQIRDFQLEHLMPDTPTEFWSNAAKTEDNNEYKQLVNNIGNLFIIDAQTNPSIGNEDFSVKKAAYQQYLPEWSVARVTRDLSEWTNLNIGTRSKEIASWARKKWSF